MDTAALANQIAQKVIADTAFWVGIIGLVGAVMSVITEFDVLMFTYGDGWGR